MPPAESLESRRLLAGTPLMVDTAFAAARSTAANAYASVIAGVRPDGSLVLVRTPVDGVAFVRRVLPDGTDDVKYGAVAIGFFNVSASALDSAGRLIVVGARRTDADDGEEITNGISVVRYDSAGDLDRTFHKKGRTDLPESDLPRSGSPTQGYGVDTVAVDAQGRTLVVFGQGPDTYVARLSVHGVLDPTFGQNGFAAVSAESGRSDVVFDAVAINVLPGGRILVTFDADYFGTSDGFDNRVRVRALGDAGAADTAYGQAGTLTLPSFFGLTKPPVTAIDSTGRLYVGVGFDAGIVERVRPDGATDQTFATGYFPDAGAFATLQKISIDAAGRVLLSGQGALARLLPDGKADPAFDFDGVVHSGGTPRSVISSPDGTTLYADDYGTIAKLDRPAAFALGRDGVLHVNAQQNDSVLRIDEVGDETRVRLDGVTHRFATAAITSLDVRMSDGDDTVRVVSRKPITLDGGDGDDTIALAGGGGHVVRLGPGRNTYTGDDGRDEVYGTDGESAGGTLNLAGGAARVVGSGLNVTATPAGDASVSVALDGGSNTVRVTGGRVYLAATGDGTNHLSATTAVAASVFLEKSSGRNFVDTGDGPDTVVGGAGRDTVRTFGGDDLVREYSNRNTIDAGDGDDSVRGGGGDDTIFGGLGRDTLRGNGGDDLLDGSAGNDKLFGNGGRDTLAGGGGDDTLIGGEGADVLGGGTGRDAADVDADDERSDVEAVAAG